MFRLFLSHRIVHLDLKGAPLKVSYLDQVIPIIKQWGATGVLLEWEDTFPYMGDLEEVGSLSNAGGDNMYSFEEVQHILKCITDNGMDPIQLVQTMGHMEYILKHPKFHELQEVQHSPAVLCPSKPRSQALVRDMIDQVLDVQPDAKFFHIGADEVWHTAICPLCKERAMKHKFKEACLYMDHIKDLILYVKQKRPDITVLMWDDMLRRMNWDVLKAYDLGEFVIPVLWNYNAEGGFVIPQNLVDAYSLLFPQVWFGTAFKGANGSCQVLSPSTRYISNHRAWVNHIRSQHESVNYCGVILTGWSRYDHYATLCEILPSALPSLAGCLRILTKAEGLEIGIPRRIRGPYNPLSMRRLYYIRMHLQQPETDNALNEVLPTAQWPGEDLARCVHGYFLAKERCLALLSSDLVNTWMNPWQMTRKFTVPGHVEGIAVTAAHSLTELQVIRANMTTFLQEITGERSTEEWVMTNIDPLLAKLTKLLEKARERALCVASVRPVVPDTEPEPDVEYCE